MYCCRQISGGDPLQELFAHLCSYKLQSLLPSSQVSLLRPPDRESMRSDLPGLWQATCRACNSLPSFTQPLQVHRLPLRDLDTGSLKFPGKPSISITLCTQTGSSWPVWLPPAFSLDTCHAWCNVTKGCAFASKEKGEKPFRSENKERENVFLHEEEVKVIQQRKALVALETLVPFFPFAELHGLTSQNCLSASVSSAKQDARSVWNARRCH